MSGLILSTRPDGLADPLVAGLEADGWTVLAVPTVAFADVAAGGALDDAARRVSAVDWAILTSRRGVEALVEATSRVGSDEAGDSSQAPGRTLATAPRRAWVAVGRATAAALAACGASPILVPAEERASAIAALFTEQENIAGTAAILAHADAAGPALADAIRAIGIDVEDVVAYRTIGAPPESAAGIAQALADPELRAIVVASGSAVGGLVALAELAGPAGTARLGVIPLISIGPSTSSAVAAAGLLLGAEAAEPTVEGLRAATAQGALVDPRRQAVAAGGSLR